MDKVTVAELAAECAVQNQVVLGELKKLGLYVSAPTATVDKGFAETIRKKILSQREAEAARLVEAEKKAEAKKEKEAAAARKAEQAAAKAPEKSAAKAPEKSAAAEKTEPAHKARKAPGKPAKDKRGVEIAAPEPAPQKLSLAPRKGKKTAHAEAHEAGIAHPPSSVELTPSQIAEQLLHEVAPAPPVEVAPPPVEEPIPEPPAPVAPKPAEARKPAEAAPSKPGVVAKKIIIPKSKSKILMRTSAEKVVTPEAGVRILKDIGQRPGPARPTGTARVLKKRRAAEAEERPGKVIEMPRRELAPEEYKPIAITEGVTLKELAEKMEIKSKFIQQKLIARGILASINQALDIEIAKSICTEFGFRADVISFEQEAEAKQEVADSAADYVARPPVVTIMGHVDHGKTSLLDAIRETSVATTEAGGITQHIGAYMVHTKGRAVTFLDTPGHEAFTLMRARGAQATDIVVLVVAADDGVMPQTIEAIHHAKAANVPIVVAINKIDKPGAQTDRAKQALSEQGLLAEDWGGETVTVPVSAKMRTNLDLLLDMILLVADMKELKGNPRRLAAGVVLEAKLDKGRGSVATVLVQNGTLKVGDSLVAGAVHGRVRALMNDNGRTIHSAGPSVPVEIQGLQDLPQAGDTFQVFEDASKTRQVAEYRQTRLREQSMRSTARFSLQTLFEQMKEGKVKELALILKADVQGSVEVLSDVLNKLSTEKVKVRILHSGVGAITETDVLLASASSAIVIGFSVRPERKAQDLADAEGVEIRLYTVIYDVSNDIKNAMIGMLEVRTQERYQGRAEVRDTFRVPKFGFVAGCYVQDGAIRRSAEVRLLRDSVVIHQGKIASLRRFKDDVGEVRTGYECGIALESYSDVKVGDVIEAYIIEKVIPTTL